MKRLFTALSISTILLSGCTKETPNDDGPDTLVAQEFKALNLCVNPNKTFNINVNIDGRRWLSNLAFRNGDGPNLFLNIKEPDTIFRVFALYDQDNLRIDTVGLTPTFKTGKYTLWCFGNPASFGSGAPKMMLVPVRSDKPTDFSTNIRFLHTWVDQDSVTIRYNGFQVTKLGYGQMTPFYNIYPSTTDRLLMLNSSGDTLQYSNGDLFASNQNYTLALTYTIQNPVLGTRNRLTYLKRQE